MFNWRIQLCMAWNAYTSPCVANKKYCADASSLIINSCCIKMHSRLQFTYSPVYDKFDGVVSKLDMYISVHRCVYALRHDKGQEFAEDNANGYFIHNTKNRFSCTLSREYWVVRNRYSRLLFTSEDRLCANLRVQEQSTNMTSEKTVPSDNGKMSDRSLFAAERYVQDIK